MLVNSFSILVMLIPFPVYVYKWFEHRVDVWSQLRVLVPSGGHKRGQALRKFAVTHEARSVRRLLALAYTPHDLWQQNLHVNYTSPQSLYPVHVLVCLLVVVYFKYFCVWCFCVVLFVQLYNCYTVIIMKCKLTNLKHCFNMTYLY